MGIDLCFRQLHIGKRLEKYPTSKPQNLCRLLIFHRMWSQSYHRLELYIATVLHETMQPFVYLETNLPLMENQMTFTVLTEGVHYFR